MGVGKGVSDDRGESNSAESGVDRHLSICAPGSKGLVRAANSITACPGRGKRGRRLRRWWEIRLPHDIVKAESP